MPPGTGDAQLSLVQATQVHGAIIVTTPQEVARRRRAARREDVPARRRAGARHRREHELVRVPALRQAVARSSAPAAASGSPTSVELPLLGQVPLYPRVMEGGDTGAPIVVADAESSRGARARRAIADASRRRGAGDARRDADARATRTPVRRLASARAARRAGARRGHERVARRSQLVADPLPRTIARVALPAVASSLLMTLFFVGRRVLGRHAARRRRRWPPCRRRCSGSG